MFGGDEEDRTPDLRIANATLSQLSYVPELIGLPWLDKGAQYSKVPLQRLPTYSRPRDFRHAFRVLHP